MAMTLRLTDDQSDALRRRAAAEGRSMQDVARSAVVSYLEQEDRRQIVDAVLDRELVRFADAIERLGQ